MVTRTAFMPVSFAARRYASLPLHAGRRFSSTLDVTENVHGWKLGFTACRDRCDVEAGSRRWQTETF